MTNEGRLPRAARLGARTTARGLSDIIAGQATLVTMSANRLDGCVPTDD
jgi:hypothetical protein